jgi:hypothetical protein
MLYLLYQEELAPKMKDLQTNKIGKIATQNSVSFPIKTGSNLV